jgi:hypothetical protein
LWDWHEFASIVGTVGFPAVMALIVFRAYVVMHAANIKSINELTGEIHRLTLAVRLQQEWRERAQLPKDYLEMADRYLRDRPLG